MDSEFPRLVCGLALILAATATATTVPNLTFEEMTDRSELVVTGQVTRVWSDWDSAHKYIWTHYELNVASSVKGSPGASVVVSELGGTVGNQVLSVAGVVTYEPGERVAVFLEKMPNGYLRTTGWGQGKYKIDSASKIHAEIAPPGVEAVDMRAPLPAGASLRTLDGISIAELRTRVTARVSAQRGKGSNR